MAKIKKNRNPRKNEGIKKTYFLIDNKIKRIFSLFDKHLSGTSRYLAPFGVLIVILILTISFFLPRDVFQQTKEKLIRNPADFHSLIIMAEKFLENNQFEEAEKILLLVRYQNKKPGNQVLGERTNQEFEKLWRKKNYSDPKDINRLISAWEKIIKEKPNYRDGYLQLAYLYYKINNDKKAKEYLNVAIELDPNYEESKKLKKIIN